MKNLLFLFLAAIILASCSKGESLEEIQQRAGLTAQEYYKLLLEDKYEDFVAGMHGGDSLPSTYREQMIANTAMFVKQQKDTHQGIKDITLSTCTADTAAHSAEALLRIEYADNVTEVVCVPLVERDGTWYMK